MEKNVITKALEENLLKNGLIILLVIISYNGLSFALRSLNSAAMGDFLLILSMLLVTVCFANFAFTYEHSEMHNTWLRRLSHLSTFIFMLLIALLLETLVISIHIVYPSVFILTLIFSILLYFGVALYDFWDFFRAFKQRK